MAKKEKNDQLLIKINKDVKKKFISLWKQKTLQLAGKSGNLWKITSQNGRNLGKMT